MRSLNIAIYSLVLTIVLFGACPQLHAGGKSRTEITPLAEVVKRNNGFAVDLYQKVKGKAGNIFFSPFSITMGMAILYGGAGGATQNEIGKTMHFPKNRDAYLKDLSELLDNVTAPEKDAYILEVCNSLWKQKGFPTKNDYLKYIRSILRCDFGLQIARF